MHLEEIESMHLEGSEEYDTIPCLNDAALETAGFSCVHWLKNLAFLWVC